MIEQEVVFASGEFRLAGTLALPRQGSPRPPDELLPPTELETRTFPAVLMIPGSGPIDRDESHPRLPLNIFGELAGHLATHGFCSLRYDKRGVGASEGDYWQAGFADNIADAAAALAFLRAHEQVQPDKVFLLGHSEGAYIATRLAAENPTLAGVVLLAGGARPPEEELQWQAKEVAAALAGPARLLVKIFRLDVVKSQQKQLDRAKRAEKDSYRVQVFGRVNAKWLRELLAYDPATDLRRISCPVLALTGAKDIQIDPANLERMAALITAPFECQVVPNVTHLLRSEPGRPTLATYKRQARKPVDPRVINLVVEWLKREATD